MEIAALGRSAGPTDDEDDAPSLTVVLEHPVTESELLLREAEEEAAEIRRRAHAEAAQIRSDARAHVRERLRRAAATAQEVTAEASSAAVTMADEARALHDEARQHAAEAAKRRETAAAAAERLLERAEAAADEIRRRAEADALAMLQEAWSASSSLQEELLDEAAAEVESMLARAEADAARLRVDAEELFRESQLLRQEAEVIREQARRYAVALANTALEATPEPSAPAAPAAPPESSPEPARWRPHRRWLLLVVAVLAATVVLRSFVVEPQTIAGVSMHPTLSEGQRVLVNKLAYVFHDPRRGDVVVIGGSEVWGDRLIKRVVGLPGETVEIRGAQVRADGRRVDVGTSTDRPAADRAPRVEFRVGDDEILVLGDNRAASRDSRSFGPVPIDDVIGRVDVVFWPPSDIGTV